MPEQWVKGFQVSLSKMQEMVPRASPHSLRYYRSLKGPQAVAFTLILVVPESSTRVTPLFFGTESLITTNPGPRDMKHLLKLP